MKTSFTVRNRQRLRRINAQLLREFLAAALAELDISAESEICFHLVNAPEMARINLQFLQHEGSTDVITFDHTEQPPHPASSCGLRFLHGEIFICVADALVQAGEFRTTWQSELVRYAVHGLLHLLGHDDLQSTARRKMKKEENRVMRRLANRFPLPRLAR